MWQTFLAKGPSGLLVLMSTAESDTLRSAFNMFAVQSAQVRVQCFVWVLLGETSFSRLNLTCC